MVKVRLEKVVEAAERLHPQCGPLFQYMFLRNDWLASLQFKTLMKSAGMQEGFRNLLNTAPQEKIEISRGELFEDQSELAIRTNTILDFLVYNDRLYLGTDKGLFDSLIAVNSTDFVSPPRKRHDAACLSASARYGTINASCGSEGLFTAIEDFVVAPHSGLGNNPAPLVRKGARSVRTSWFDHSIMNYSVNAAPTFIRTEYTKASRGEKGASVLTGISDDENNLSSIFDGLEQEYGIEGDDVQYTYNFVHSLFLQTIKGRFYGATLESQDTVVQSVTVKDATLAVRSFKEYKEFHESILSVDTSSAGQVIETENAVVLFSQDDFLPIVHEPVFSVRTFGQSKRYKNLIVLAQSDGVRIVSAFDDVKHVGLAVVSDYDDFRSLGLPQDDGL